MRWRYSLRWKLPSPCPGPHELASEVVEAGQPAPESIMSLWVAGAGYAVCVDFPDERQIKRWSDERKAAARRRNLERRVNRMAPLFAEELIERELEGDQTISGENLRPESGEVRFRRASVWSLQRLKEKSTTTDKESADALLLILSLHC
jgi:hypothetical protein